MSKNSSNKTPAKPGPNTPAGRATSSQNALTHGMIARKPILPGESQADLDLLLAHYHAKYPSQDPVLASLVTRAAHYDWYLQRTQRGFDSTMAELYKTDQLAWTEDQHRQYQRAHRYLTADQRQLDRARQQILQDYRESRAQQRFDTAQTPETKPSEPEPSPAPPPVLELEPARQTVQIFPLPEGETCVLLTPTNKNLLDILKNCPQITAVRRIISFPKGEIPSDYAWLPVTNPQAKLAYKLTLDEFREQAAREPEKCILPTILDKVPNDS